jgi:hypothetical protein
MKHRSRDVTATPPTPVSGFGEQGINSREAPSSARPAFTLPNKVSAQQIQQESFRYGGGRSAGNRSLETNQNMQKRQP